MEIETETGTERHRQTDRQTDRQTETETETERKGGEETSDIYLYRDLLMSNKLEYSDGH